MDLASNMQHRYTQINTQKQKQLIIDGLEVEGGVWWSFANHLSTPDQDC